METRENKWARWEVIIRVHTVPWGRILKIPPVDNRRIPAPTLISPPFNPLFLVCTVRYFGGIRGMLTYHNIFVDIFGMLTKTSHKLFWVFFSYSQWENFLRRLWRNDETGLYQWRRSGDPPDIRKYPPQGFTKFGPRQLLVHQNSSNNTQKSSEYFLNTNKQRKDIRHLIVKNAVNKMTFTHLYFATIHAPVLTRRGATFY